MKGERVKELFRKVSVKAGVIAMATALVISGSVWVDYQNRTPIPELVTFVDSEGSISIVEEEVPLAAPKVTVSTKTTKKTKKIKMKKASKKTYSKKQTKKKTSTKKASSSSETTTTQTVTDTKIVNKYKKGSKINTRVTTVKTTVTKTVVSRETAAPQASVSGISGTSSAHSTQVNTNAAGSIPVQTEAAGPADLTIETAAPALDARVTKAYNTLGFKVKVNPNVSYSGLFDARTRMITLKQPGDTVYHELGHFVAFLAGNVDRSASFQQVFANEKSKYNEFNKGYVLSSTSEYFAESFKNYTLNPAALQASRPQTYAAMQAALNTITDAHVARIASVYSAVWN